MQIFKLFGSILVDSDKANDSIAKTEKKAGGLGSKLGSVIGTAAKVGAGIATGVAAGGAAMIALGVKVGNAADEILDLNSITGMSTDSIQAWRKASEVAGVATDAMANASQKLTRNMDTMQLESNKGNKALKDLGFSLKDIENMDADERMNVLTEALAGVDDKTERARLGADIFAGSWKEIAPIVDMGTEAMNKAKDSANIISEEDLKKANDFRISVADMKEQVSFFVTEIGIKLLPILQSMFDWIRENMPAIKKVAETVFDAIGSSISFVVEWISKLIGWLSEWRNKSDGNLTEIKTMFLELFSAIREYIEAYINFAVKAWEMYGDDILGILKVLFDFIVDVFKTAIRIITDIFKVFAALFRGDWRALWDGLLSILETVLGLIWRTLQRAVDLILRLFGTDLATVKKKVSDIFNSIKDTVLGIFDTVVNRIKSAIQTIKDLIDSVLGAYKKAKDTVSNFVSGAKDKISNVIDGAVGWIPGFVDGTDDAPGGLSIVGERGPELVNLPKNSQVFDNDETERILDREQTIHTTVNIDGRKVASATSKPQRDRIDKRNYGQGVPVT